MVRILSEANYVHREAKVFCSLAYDLHLTLTTIRHHQVRQRLTLTLKTRIAAMHNLIHGCVVIRTSTVLILKRR